MLRQDGQFYSTALREAHLSYRAYGELLDGVRTGHSPFVKAHGQTVYEYLAAHPEVDRAYADSMRRATSAVADSLVAAYDFAPMRTLVDVGGDGGALLAALLHRHPHLRGVVFDRPSVVAAARPRLEAAGLAGRCELVGGDFFESVPGGADAYLLTWVLSDWDDGRAARIVQTCRRAMTGDSVLLVIDPLDLPSNADFHLLMWAVWNGGGVRGEDEYARVFSRAGLALTRVIPTDTPFSILEGRLAD